MRTLLVGCGNHGGRTLLPAALAAGFTITGVVDNNLPEARRIAAQWSIPAVCDGIGDIDPRSFDAVLLALPAPLQADHVRWALEHHLAIFVEKPPAPDPHRLRELADLADQRGVVCCVGMNFRWSQGVLALCAALESGRYGTPCYVRVVHIASKPLAPFSDTDSLEASLFHAQGIHAIDLACLLLPEAVAVSGQMVAVDRGLLCVMAGDDLSSGRRMEASFGSSAAGFYHQVEVVTGHGDLLRLSDLSELVHLPHGGAADVQDYPGARVLWRRSPLADGHTAAGYTSELTAFAQRLAGHAVPRLATLADLLPVYDAYDELLMARGLKWTA